MSNHTVTIVYWAIPWHAVAYRCSTRVHAYQTARHQPGCLVESGRLTTLCQICWEVVGLAASVYMVLPRNYPLPVLDLKLKQVLRRRSV